MGGRWNEKKKQIVDGAAGVEYIGSAARGAAFVYNQQRQAMLKRKVSIDYSLDKSIAFDLQAQYRLCISDGKS